MILWQRVSTNAIATLQLPSIEEHLVRVHIASVTWLSLLAAAGLIRRSFAIGVSGTADCELPWAPRDRRASHVGTSLGQLPRLCVLHSSLLIYSRVCRSEVFLGSVRIKKTSNC